MNDCTNKPRCFSIKDEKRKSPIRLSNSFYKYRPKIKNNTADQLTLWKSEKYHFDEKYNEIFNTNLNEVNENIIPKDKSANAEQCNCINAWKQLKQVFEPTDEDLKRTHSLKSMILEDTFYTMPIDLNNDNHGENLKDFHLDGEYLFKKLDNSNNYNNSHNINNNNRNAFNNEKELVTDEPKESPIIESTQILETANKQKDTIQIENIKSIDPLNTNTNKTIEFNIEHNNENIKNTNKKTYSKNQIKAFKKSNKCCPVTKSNKLDNIKKKRENKMEYLYTYGELYRGGIQCGHKNCVDCFIPIARNRGWITDEYINYQREKANEKRLLNVQEGGKRASIATDTKAMIKKRDKQTKSFMTNHSNTSTIDKTSTAKDALGEETAPVFEMKKTNGVYTITMNNLTEEGQINMADEPVVFRLGAHKNTAESISSYSSFEFKCVPPAAIRALRPQKTQRDVYTMYDKEHFTPTEKKRHEKKVHTKQQN